MANQDNCRNIERERADRMERRADQLKAERDELVEALRELSDAVKWRHRDADNLDRAHNAAARALAKVAT